MLGIHIEEEWKIDSDKRFEKFIFRTIDTSSIIENKVTVDKTEEKKRATSIKKSEKIKENPALAKNFKKKRLNSKKKNLKNKSEKTLYELISVTETDILLQKKQYRKVK